jgi:hypothetical protein
MRGYEGLPSLTKSGQKEKILPVFIPLLYLFLSAIIGGLSH